MRLFYHYLIFFLGLFLLPVYGHPTGDSPDDTRLSSATLRQRVLRIDSDIPLRYNRRVRDFIHYFIYDRRDYVRRIQNRSSLYFPIFEEALARHGLPESLKYLPIIESALRPQARSRSGAVGLWQFMPATGRMMGLKQNRYIDERRDPYKATEAACLYLKDLYRHFRDWELVLAAFNAGPGHISRSLRRSGKRSYWRITRYLSRETRAYVPQFMAMVYVMRYAPHHNLMAEAPQYLRRWDTLHVKEMVDLRALAEAMDLCYEDLWALNPCFVRGLVPKHPRGYVLRIPSERSAYTPNERAMWIARANKAGEALFKQLQTQTYAGKRKIHYRIRRGDVLGSIAHRYGLRVSDIKRWNGLRSSRIIAGKSLVLWLNNQRRTKAPPRRVSPTARYHIVRAGDTLWDIAMMYRGLSLRELRQLNHIGRRNSRIMPGQRLRIRR